MLTARQCSTSSPRLLSAQRYGCLAARPRGSARRIMAGGGGAGVRSASLAAFSTPLSRRGALLALGFFAGSPPGPALAVLDGAPKEVGPVPAFQIEDFTPAGGWEEMGSGLLVRVLRPGEGDRAKGIFDRVDHFQPFPFVTVRFTAYEPSGNVFASTIATRRDYNYQAGVRQELQDEDGAVMSMVVGERRQFVVPVELAYKRKLFGSPVPQRKTLLVDVELLGLQPY
mmetsp:Transcript_15976/g.40595  ORF Transcript_15976/g.40595 Transcript_15976/m.40595 type:complete len:227 (-) Transcript_15976:302-982(-)